MKRIKTFTGKTFNLETFELFFHTQLFSVYFCAYTVDIQRQNLQASVYILCMSGSRVPDQTRLNMSGSNIY